MTDDDLLPPEYLAYYRQLEIGPLAADGRPLAASALPHLAARHYMTGGCYILAGALASLTGLAISVTVDSADLPRHAFVVHGSDFIDAFGRQSIAALSSERVHDGLSVRQVADMLLLLASSSASPHGRARRTRRPPRSLPAHRWRRRCSATGAKRCRPARLLRIDFLLCGVWVRGG